MYSWDHPGERPGAIERVVALAGEPGAGGVAELDGDLPVGELRLQLHHELVDDLGHDLRQEAC